MAKGSKLSKMAANRLAVTTTVTSSANVHGAELAATLHQTLFPSGPVKPELTERLLEALSDALDRAAAQMQQADWHTLPSCSMTKGPGCVAMARRHCC